ncbi:MAG: TldD/PmbA family protein [Candidatus Electryoneaceae bacterium]|nr:TldD/PmbA family protein [Candidatus Electryoneaceae bacterium]
MRRLSDKALSYADGYETEVMVSSGDSALTRFGESVITQNLASSSVGISVRLIKDGRMGKASTGNVSDDGIRRCVETAKAALVVAESDDDLLPLLGAQTYQQRANFYQSTFDLSPEARAQGVVKAVELCRKNDLQGAGIFSNDGGNMAIATSAGLWAYHQNTDSSFSLSAMSDDSSGWAEEGDADVGKIDIDRLASTAIRKGLDCRNPIDVDPGSWTVIFEAAAVADFLMFLGWEALNGKAFVEGRSCFSGKVGQKVVGENITLTDDAFHSLSPGIPFDFEGMPRQAVTMIENGVFLSAVHDRESAKKAATESTGHALPKPDTNGPMPLNLIMSPGESSLEEMIAGTDRGLLVTRLHYCNILDPMKMMLTGMTRDGLFLIENGKVTNGVKNMRYTESVLHILANVEALSEHLYKTETFWGGGGTVVPAIKVNDFHFTSRTEN